VDNSSRADACNNSSCNSSCPISIRCIPMRACLEEGRWGLCQARGWGRRRKGEAINLIRSRGHSGGPGVRQANRRTLHTARPIRPTWAAAGAGACPQRPRRSRPPPSPGRRGRTAW
jgi:hypothetical protein